MAAQINAPAAAFQPGDRWCVVGDSITHGGRYHHYIELFYSTRYPQQQLDVINCGISGDQVEDAVSAARLASQPKPYEFRLPPVRVPAGD